MSIGRLLKACGWEETPSTAPVTHEHDCSAVPGTSIDIDITGKYPVICAILPNGGEAALHQGHSAAYLLADALDRDIADARARGLADAGIRIGAHMFADDVLDRLEAAGVLIEARPDGGIVLNMPNSVEIVAGNDIVQALSPGRLEPGELSFPDLPRHISEPHSYLQHDPTKTHQNARRRRRKGRK